MLATLLPSTTFLYGTEMVYSHCFLVTRLIKKIQQHQE